MQASAAVVTGPRSDTTTTAGASVWIFVLLVTAAGVVTLQHATLTLLATPINGYALAFAALTVGAGRFSLKIPGRSATVSFSEIFIFTSIILLGPAPATVTVAIDGLWMSLRQRRRRLYRTVFNVTEPAVSVWIAGHAFFWVMSSSSDGLGGPGPLVSVVATLVLAGTYFGLNSALTAAAVAIESRASIVAVWRQHALYLAVNDYAAASLATLLVREGMGIDLRAVSLVAPLVLLSYAAYKAATTRGEEAQRHLHEVEHLYAATIETLAIAVDAKDQVTHGHIRRVQRHAVALAARLGVTDAVALKALAAASLLHDVGKLAVPDYVLNKPGRLTGAEFARIKEHANAGAAILTKVEFPYPVVPIVRYHHEQWNGRGYPDGLAGETIPLGARILSVVDCFDALTSNRPYRRKMSDADAASILVERRGVMYDPQVVDAFLALLPELRRDDDVQSGAMPIGASPMPSAARRATSDDDRVTIQALRRGGATIAAQVTRVIGHMECCLFVSSDTGDELEVAYATGAIGQILPTLSLRLGEGLSGWVAANRHTIVNSHADLDLGAAAQDLRLTTCLSTPIFALGDLVAVFSVYTPRPLSPAEAGALGRLGQEVGLDVARAREHATDVMRGSRAVTGVA